MGLLGLTGAMWGLPGARREREAPGASLERPGLQKSVSRMIRGHHFWMSFRDIDFGTIFDRFLIDVLVLGTPFCIDF